MFSINNDWNPKQARLRSIIKKEGDFQETIELCLKLHSIVHMPEVSGSGEYIFDGLTISNSKLAVPPP